MVHLREFSHQGISDRVRSGTFGVGTTTLKSDIGEGDAVENSRVRWNFVEEVVLDSDAVLEDIN